jgi:hypothetical protein
MYRKATFLLNKREPRFEILKATCCQFSNCYYSENSNWCALLPRERMAANGGEQAVGRDSGSVPVLSIRSQD